MSTVKYGNLSLAVDERLVNLTLINFLGRSVQRFVGFGVIEVELDSEKCLILSR